MVDVGAEENCPQGTYHEADGKCRHREHQRGEFAAGRKVGAADRGAEIAEDHEVVHFQKISARHAEHRSYLLLALFGRRHLQLNLCCATHHVYAKLIRWSAGPLRYGTKNPSRRLTRGAVLRTSP